MVLTKEARKLGIERLRDLRSDPNYIPRPKKLTPIKAIKEKCLDCCAWQKNEVKLCETKRCALWPYRLGHIPDAGVLEETQKLLEEFKAKCMKVGR